jgi:hypothetical protein
LAADRLFLPGVRLSKDCVCDRRNKYSQHDLPEDQGREPRTGKLGTHLEHLIYAQNIRQQEQSAEDKNCHVSIHSTSISTDAGKMDVT